MCQGLGGRWSLHPQRLVASYFKDYNYGKVSCDKPRDESEHPGLCDPPRPVHLARTGDFPTRKVPERRGIFDPGLLLASLWWRTSPMHRLSFPSYQLMQGHSDKNDHPSKKIFLLICPNGQSRWKESAPYQVMVQIITILRFSSKHL